MQGAGQRPPPPCSELSEAPSSLLLCSASVRCMVTGAPPRRAPHFRGGAREPLPVCGGGGGARAAGPRAVLGELPQRLPLRLSCPLSLAQPRAASCFLGKNHIQFTFGGL